MNVLSISGITVLVLLAVMFILLAKEKLRPGIILFAVLTALMALGIITADEAIAGFSNKGMLTVLILFFVSEGVRQTGALNRLVGTLLPKKKGPLPLLLLKMMLPVSILSAFLNNTPVVIIFAPMIKKWAEKLRLPPSKFLIPLSYATIFGGVCTLIGTSTNLVIHGLMLENGFDGLGMFELGKVGVFIAIAGTIYLSLAGPLLLPGKKKKEEYVEQKKYYYNAIITEKSQFIDKKVSYGHFPGHRDIIVTHIERGDEKLVATSGETELKANDRLIIHGNESILEQLITINGINLEDYENIDPWFKNKKLIKTEVVLSESFPAIGQTLNEFNFYNYYRGIVAAIQRNGEKITTHTGNVQLKAGDCLVVLSTPNFIERWNGRRDFYLLSDRGEVETPQSKPRIWISLGLTLLMVIGATLSDKIPAINGNRIDMFFLAACVTTIMFLSKLISPKNYTSAVNWDVLITIACAFGISRAVQNSGLADSAAGFMINIVKDSGPIAVLAVLYILTMLFTEVITNNAAVAIMFPISLAVANHLGVSPHPFFIAICIAASSSFSTPIGYQTNMIVQGIGEYKFKDFLKVGLPLNILVMIISLTLIPIFWNF